MLNEKVKQSKRLQSKKEQIKMKPKIYFLTELLKYLENQRLVILAFLEKDCFVVCWIVNEKAKDM